MYPIKTQDKLFHDGDGLTELGTVVTATFLNTIQAELMNVLVAAGITVDETNQQQVAEAIQTLIKNNKPPIATDNIAGIAKVLNTLNSDDTLNALSAAMGKKLADEKLDKKDIRKLGVPAGAIQFFTMQKAPDGWLEADGKAVSRIQYADLFAAIGTHYGAGDGLNTFNLPDLRGQFVRGWDNGRGVDNGRLLGSWQESSNKSHQHTGATGSTGAHQHTGQTANSGNHTHPVGRNTGVYLAGTGTISILNNNGSNSELTWSGDHFHWFTTDWAGDHSHGFQTDPAGGNESRPINIALLVCIKI